jgi:hypothetical protein
LAPDISVRTPRHKALEFRLSKVGFPIRKSADQSFFAAPHGLSQRSTSFIASQRQGIHRTPLRHLIALIINVHTLGRMRSPLCPREESCAAGTLTRKTSLLRKIEPMARRSGFANRIIYNSLSSHDENERRNDPEIVKGRAIACTIQLGSISSLRCQKSRMSFPGERRNMRSDAFADDVCGVA